MKIMLNSGFSVFLTFSTCTFVLEVAYVPGANENDISNDVTDESITHDAAHVNETSTLTTEANLKQISLQQKTVLADDSAEGTMPLFNLLVPADDTIVDLPLQITDDGVLRELPSAEMEAVSDKTALHVVESALPPGTMAKYCAAYISGVSINDDIYPTWKMYKSKNVNKSATPEEVMNTHFPIPETKTKTTK
jgi:hypothetical protein